jgi:hypothetical protein
MKGVTSSVRAFGRPRSIWVAMMAAPPLCQVRFDRAGEAGDVFHVERNRGLIEAPERAAVTRRRASDRRRFWPADISPARRWARSCRSKASSAGAMSSARRPRPRRSGSRPRSAAPSARRHGRHRRWRRARSRSRPQAAVSGPPGCAEASSCPHRWVRAGSAPRPARRKSLPRKHLCRAPRAGKIGHTQHHGPER